MGFYQAAPEGANLPPLWDPDMPTQFTSSYGGAVVNFAQYVTPPEPGQLLSFAKSGTWPDYISLSSGGIATIGATAPVGSVSDVYDCRITATDEEGLATQSVELRFTIVKGTNRAPTWATIPAHTLYLGETVNLNSYATDLDGDQLTFTLVNPALLPAGWTFANGVLTAVSVGAGSYQFVFQAHDGTVGVSCPAISVQIVALSDEALFEPDYVGAYRFATGSLASGTSQPWQSAPVDGIGRIITWACDSHDGDGENTLREVIMSPDPAQRVHRRIGYTPGPPAVHKQYIGSRDYVRFSSVEGPPGPSSGPWTCTLEPINHDVGNGQVVLADMLTNEGAHPWRRVYASPRWNIQRQWTITQITVGSPSVWTVRGRWNGTVYVSTDPPSTGVSYRTAGGWPIEEYDNRNYTIFHGLNQSSGSRGTFIVAGEGAFDLNSFDNDTYNTGLNRNGYTHGPYSSNNDDVTAWPQGPYVQGRSEDDLLLMPKNEAALGTKKVYGRSGNRITCAGHGYTAGQRVVFTDGAPPAPLYEDILYRVKNPTADDFEVEAYKNRGAKTLTSAPNAASRVASAGTGTTNNYEHQAVRGALLTAFNKAFVYLPSINKAVCFGGERAPTDSIFILEPNTSVDSAYAEPTLPHRWLVRRLSCTAAPFTYTHEDGRTYAILYQQCQEIRDYACAAGQYVYFYPKRDYYDRSPAYAPQHWGHPGHDNKQWFFRMNVLSLAQTGDPQLERLADLPAMRNVHPLSTTVPITISNLVASTTRFPNDKYTATVTVTAIPTTTGPGSFVAYKLVDEAEREFYMNSLPGAGTHTGRTIYPVPWWSSGWVRQPTPGPNCTIRGVQYEYFGAMTYDSSVNKILLFGPGTALAAYDITANTWSVLLPPGTANCDNAYSPSRVTAGQGSWANIRQGGNYNNLTYSPQNQISLFRSDDAAFANQGYTESVSQQWSSIKLVAPAPPARRDTYVPWTVPAPYDSVLQSNPALTLWGGKHFRFKYWNGVIYQCGGDFRGYPRSALSGYPPNLSDGLPGHLTWATDFTRQDMWMCDTNTLVDGKHHWTLSNNAYHNYPLQADGQGWWGPGRPGGGPEPSRGWYGLDAMGWFVDKFGQFWAGPRFSDQFAVGGRYYGPEYWWGEAAGRYSSLNNSAPPTNLHSFMMLKWNLPGNHTNGIRYGNGWTCPAQNLLALSNHPDYGNPGSVPYRGDVHTVGQVGYDPVTHRAFITSFSVNTGTSWGFDLFFVFWFDLTTCQWSRQQIGGNIPINFFPNHGRFRDGSTLGEPIVIDRTMYQVCCGLYNKTGGRFTGIDPWAGYAIAQEHHTFIIKLNLDTLALSYMELPAAANWWLNIWDGPASTDVFFHSPPLDAAYAVRTTVEYRDYCKLGRKIVFSADPWLDVTAHPWFMIWDHDTQTWTLHDPPAVSPGVTAFNSSMGGLCGLEDKGEVWMMGNCYGAPGDPTFNAAHSMRTSNASLHNSILKYRID